MKDDRATLSGMYYFYICLHTVINAISETRKSAYEETLEKINTMSPEEIKIFEKKINEQIIEDKRKYGVIASDEDIIYLAEMAKKAEADKSLLVPKFYLLNLFENYAAALPNFDDLPIYARIAIRYGYKNLTETTIDKPQVEIHLPEAQIFEDIALLYNQIVDDDLKDKKPYKLNSALARSIIISCFNLIEAYINGCSADFQFNTTRELTDIEKEILNEKDKNGKQKYVSLRDKLLQYPKIILEKKHPIIQESNSASFRYIMTEVKDLRDSIVHISHSFDEIGSEKEALFLTFDYTNIEKIIDNTLELIKQIEKIINPNKNNLWWLYERKDSKYDDSVFS